jgi:hypothetical protein
MKTLLETGTVGATALSLGLALCLALGPQAALGQETTPPERASPSGPTAAGHGLTPACRAAKQYIDLAVADKFSQIGDLFADHVSYVGPDAVPLATRAEIQKVYQALGEGAARQGKPLRPRLERLVPLHDNECFMEFALYDYGRGEFRPFAVDHFIVNDEGKVIWFRPYFQENQSGWFK